MHPCFNIIGYLWPVVCCFILDLFAAAGAAKFKHAYGFARCLGWCCMTAIVLQAKVSLAHRQPSNVCCCICLPSCRQNDSALHRARTKQHIASIGKARDQSANSANCCRLRHLYALNSISAFVWHHDMLWPAVHLIALHPLSWSWTSLPASSWNVLELLQAI